MSKRIYYAFAVVILLLASGMRFWNITTLPAGLSDVEISHVNVIEDEIRRGSIRVFYERDTFTDDGREITGQEGLYPLVLSAVTIPFGTGTFGLRVLSVLLGMVTLATLYTLGVRLFGLRVGIITMAMYAVMMFPTLLSRLVITETALPLMVASVMLALARAFPVYYRTRAESTNTLDFAVMGVLISMSFYLHDTSLFIVLMAMAFIAYLLILQRQASTRRWSYIGFGMLMFFIIAMPYGLSTLRLPELVANTRILGDYESITLSILESTLGLMWQGDTNVLYNLPNRPMMDIVSGFLLIIGIVFCVQNWRTPRFGLILIAIIFLGPPAVIGDVSPSFREMAIVLPVIALLVGIGAGEIIELTPKRIRPIFQGLVAILIIGNLGWTIDSLYNHWANLDDARIAYNSDIGEIALHFDHTADDIPVVICNPDWDIRRATTAPYTGVDLVKLHMNRDAVLLREVDCRNGFVFVNAGQHQQVLIVDPMQANDLLPLVADWISLGTPIIDLQSGTVIDLQIQRELEDALGVLTTTTPASYATNADVSARVPVAPPIRFGGNVTWLGYETDPFPQYPVGGVVPVGTYWRIEGLVPSDLLVFTHLLSDPIFPAAQTDNILIDPIQLRERDVYIHNASVSLSLNIEARDYVVSVGVYQSSSDERLPVFLDERSTQGNRIFLYQVTIEANDTSGN